MRRLLLVLPFSFVLLPGSFPSPASHAGRGTVEEPPLPDVLDKGGRLPTNAKMEKLARSDPVAFLEHCLRRYDREVKGYRVTLRKQERIAGELRPTEVIGVQFREEPFSVRMEWRKGARLASKTLYVRGAHGDKIQVVPTGLLALAGVVARDPDGPDARSSSRYPITEFGIKIGMQRTLGAFRKARAEEALHVEFLGTKKVKEVGGRECWVFRRGRYKKPEVDGITGLTMYIDPTNWLQVGSTLKGAGNRLIGEYFFVDLELNPEFGEDAFTPAGLKR